MFAMLCAECVQCLCLRFAEICAKLRPCFVLNMCCDLCCNSAGFCAVCVLCFVPYGVVIYGLLCSVLC